MHCSFCGKDETKVKQIFTTSRTKATICDKCIFACIAAFYTKTELQELTMEDLSEQQNTGC